MIRNVLWPVKNIKNKKGYIESLAQSYSRKRFWKVNVKKNL